MDTIQYQIRFHDFWCVTSGLSGGAKADILTLKDANGLPYIPGRTLKGLLREAAETLEASGLVNPDWTKAFFGEREWKENSENKEAHKNDQHRKREQGAAFFSNATLNQATASALINSDNATMLFEILASTAIDNETGIAMKHSLRRTETTIPCTLYGEIHVEQESESLKSKEIREQLDNCMKFIKRLGYHRTRGLGRCTFQLLNHEEASI